jgi:DNA-binding GntR family transcriptional regulator
MGTPEPSDDAVPQYLRIVNHYRSLIDAGQLVVGERLPSARDLADEWGVARLTADKAVARLHDDGYVEKRDRSRAVVRARDDHADGFSMAIQLPAALREFAVESSQVIITDDVLSKRLSTPEGTPLVVLRLSPPKS